MKRLSIVWLAVLFSLSTFAGNPDRSGQAGAYELLINPYAKSSGLHSLNTASANGVEAMRLNVAGLGDIAGAELVAVNSLWLAGSGLQINNLAYGTKIGDSSAFGIEVFSFNFGEVDYTTTNNPEGNIGTFRPSFVNIALSYARKFSREINAGLTLRAINESMGNVSASGIALDAGVTYMTGKYDHFKFGVALRNIGTPIKFDGDGLSDKTKLGTNDFDQTIQQRANVFELPSLMHIGLAYDFLNAKRGADKKKSEAWRVTAVGNFQSNSFTNDELGIGGEVSYLERFTLRGSYRWSEGVIYVNDEESSFVYSGVAGGLSILIPVEGDVNNSFSLDIAHRMTNTYSGVTSVGVTLKF